jgi:hypothetical protein
VHRKKNGQWVTQKVFSKFLNIGKYLIEFIPRVRRRVKRKRKRKKCTSFPIKLKWT